MNRAPAADPRDASLAHAPAPPGGLVLQFGHGVFLRGHIDWMLQQSRERDLWSGRVLGVKLRASSGPFPLASHPAYPMTVRGMSGGKAVEASSDIDVVEGWCDPHTAGGWREFLATAREPQVDAIMSNSTEAGITYVAISNRPTDECPPSFPAKLAAWLAARHEASLDGGGGIVSVLPLELIEDNGGALRQIVRRHANDWQLGAEFEIWLDACVEFRSTLVDRIVTKPAPDEDPLLVIAEPYHLLAVQAAAPPSRAAAGARKKRAREENDDDDGGGSGGGGGELERRLRLRRAGLNVVYTHHLDELRTRKVRLLNGAHHTLVFLGLRAGLGNVRECVEHPILGERLLEHVLRHEVIPTLSPAPAGATAPGGSGGSGDVDEAAHRAELDGYVSSVLERFRNPFLDHRLTSIALNSAAKVQTRLLPTIADYAAAHRGRLPPGLTLAVAAFLAHTDPLIDGCDASVVRAACSKVAGLQEELERLVTALKERDVAQMMDEAAVG
jgi:tagaturonate reductase